jgi:hypothetical protein
MGKIVVECDVCSNAHSTVKTSRAGPGPSDFELEHEPGWSVQGYRGVPGVVCPGCSRRIDGMPHLELQALITSTKVANALTP